MGLFSMENPCLPGQLSMEINNYSLGRAVFSWSIPNLERCEPQRAAASTQQLDQTGLVEDSTVQLSTDEMRRVDSGLEYVLAHLRLLRADE